MIYVTSIIFRFNRGCKQRCGRGRSSGSTESVFHRDRYGKTGQTVDFRRGTAGREGGRQELYSGSVKILGEDEEIGTEALELLEEAGEVEGSEEAEAGEAFAEDEVFPEDETDEMEEEAEV